MVNKNIEKKFVWLFVFVLIMKIVCVSGGWGDISSGENSEDNTVFDDDIPTGSSSVNGDSDNNFVVQEDFGREYFDSDVLASFFDEDRYTRDFYIALGLGGVVILMILLFIYLFIRNPKNRWKKIVKKKRKRSSRKRKSKK